jgi:hypothetical protein
LKRIYHCECVKIFLIASEGEKNSGTWNESRGINPDAFYVAYSAAYACRNSQGTKKTMMADLFACVTQAMVFSIEGFSALSSTAYNVM